MAEGEPWRSGWRTICPVPDDDPDLSAAFRSQDLYSAYYNGTSWSAPVRITDDDYADGEPALAFDTTTGDALLVWSRSLQADATDRSGFEIAYSKWDAVAKSWLAPKLATNDAAADWVPQLAFNGNSQAMVIWPRDTDGDLDTVELAYAEWNGNLSGMSISSEWQRALDMSITAAPDNSFLVAAVEKQRFEGLISASYDPVTQQWGDTELVSAGNDMQATRMRVNNAGTVAALWQAVGPSGNYDLWLATRDLVGGGDWTQAYQLTDDPEIEWGPVLLFDDDGDPYVVYELGSENGSPPIEDTESLPDLGTDVGIAQVELVPDLAVASIDVGATFETKQARLFVDVVNRGLTDSAATLVSFYEGDPDAGGTLIGPPINLPGLLAGELVPVTSSIFVPPVGDRNFFVVVAPDPDETVLDNNTTYAPIDRAPPDQSGPRVSVDVASSELVPTGTGVLTLLFDEPIAGLLATDVSLVEQTRGSRPPDYVSLTPDRTSATLVFEGGLAHGRYTLKVRDRVQDVAGNALDGDADGNPGGDYITSIDVYPGDFNDDGIYDFHDIDALVSKIASGTHAAGFDLTGDGLVDLDDRDAWLSEAGLLNLPSGNPYLLGDANLDGSVDVSDFNAWNAHKFTAEAAWSRGDFSADGFVDVSDFNIWNTSKFTTAVLLPAPSQHIGEPADDDVHALSSVSLDETFAKNSLTPTPWPRRSMSHNWLENSFRSRRMVPDSEEMSQAKSTIVDWVFAAWGELGRWGVGS